MEEVEKYREKKRERRIRNRLRMIARAKRYAATFYYEPDNPAIARMWKHEWWDMNHQLHTKMDTWEEVFLARESWARMSYNNIVTCSDWCCGSPRKHHKSMTVQEAKAEENARQQFEEEGYNYKGVRFCTYYF